MKARLRVGAEGAHDVELLPPAGDGARRVLVDGEEVAVRVLPGAPPGTVWVEAGESRLEVRVDAVMGTARLRSLAAGAVATNGANWTGATGAATRAAGGTAGGDGVATGVGGVGGAGGADRQANGAGAGVAARPALDVAAEAVPFKVDEFSRASGPAAGGSGGAVRVRPPMSGRLVEVRVAAGAQVRKGDVLFVLEAMKMQNEVRSPAAGVVASIQAKAGETLGTDRVVLEVKPTG